MSVGARTTRTDAAPGSVAAAGARAVPGRHALLRLQGACGNRAVTGLVVAHRPRLAVQRNVGFEFQTAGTKTGIYESIAATEKKKESKTVYYRGEGFSVENDEGDLELVTDSFQETAQGYRALWGTLIWMVMFAERLDGRTVPLTSPLLAHLAPQSAVTDERRARYVLRGDTPVLAEPQATAGVELDKLMELATLLSTARPRNATYYKPTGGDRFVRKGEVPLTTLTPRLERRREQGLADHIGWKAFQGDFFQGTVMANAVKFPGDVGGTSSPRLSGFLFQLAQYVIAANKYSAMKVFEGKVPWWFKLAVPMMSRTNLADQFLKLERSDRTWFADNIGLVHAGLKKYSSKDIAFPAGMRGELLQGDVKITEWLMCLVPTDGVESNTPGTDLSSRYEGVGDISTKDFTPAPPWGANDHNSETAAAEKNKSRNKYINPGNMLSSTDIGPVKPDGKHRMDGALVELRKLGAKLAPQEWLPFAAAVFELIVLLNQGEQRRDEIVE